MVAPGENRLSLREFLREDLVAALFAPGAELFAESGVGGGEDFGGEERGVGGSGFADGQRSDGHALGHLHDGEQRVDSVEHGCGDGDAEDRDEGFGGEHSGEMGGAAGSGDDDAEAAGFGLLGVLEEPVGRAVRGDDARFVRDGEELQDFDGGCEDFVVTLAAHHDADEDWPSWRNRIWRKSGWTC